jgi:hypothetical protein
MLAGAGEIGYQQRKDGAARPKMSELVVVA